MSFIFRHLTYSVFLSLAVGLFSHASCSNTVSQKSLGIDRQKIEYQNSFNVEALFNKTLYKIDKQIIQNKKAAPKYLALKKFVIKNSKTIMRLLDTYSALRVLHKLINLQFSGSVELQEIIIISLIVLGIESSKSIKSMLPHRILTSILLVLVYRIGTTDTSTLIDPWVLYSIVCNGLSCSTISHLTKAYGFSAIKRSIQSFYKASFKASKALPREAILSLSA